ncbi:hypothetical protein GGF43_006091, partial [Coemansia sp. RSA 2618]
SISAAAGRTRRRAAQRFPGHRPAAPGGCGECRAGEAATAARLLQGGHNGRRAVHSSGLQVPNRNVRPGVWPVRAAAGALDRAPVEPRRDPDARVRGRLGTQEKVLWLAGPGPPVARVPRGCTRAHRRGRWRPGGIAAAAQARCQYGRGVPIGLWRHQPAWVADILCVAARGANVA